MSKMRSSGKSKSRTNSRRPISVNMKKSRGRKVRTKPMKKKFNVPVREQNKLQVKGIELTLEERMEPYFSGLNDNIHVPQVDDSDDDFISPPKQILRCPELKCCIAEPIVSCSTHQSPPKGTYIKLRKTVLDVATQNLPILQENEARDEFDATGVKIAKDCQPHVLLNQSSNKSSSLGYLLNVMKISIHYYVHFVFSNFLHPNMQTCNFSKESITSRIDRIQNTHEKLVSDHYRLKIEFEYHVSCLGKMIHQCIEAVKTCTNVNDEMAASAEDLKLSHTTDVNVKGSMSYQAEVFLEDNSKSKKQKTNSNSEGIAGETLNESNYSQDVYGLDDDLVFTE
ncbi:Uncharacterized protein Fot_53820 [Forsythia ovata]|uniref:Uncharacterized protein n=1 Tax=Forsythia ovata TaxID=205694 RepID=A0ABD1PFA9_9LAMI